VPAYAEIAGWHYADPATPQRAMLPAAYQRAGIDPADIQFVEGHGAATATDDLAELSALLGCHPRPSSGRRPRFSWRPSTPWAPPLTRTSHDRAPSTSCCAANATSPTARAAGASHPCCQPPP
jgi:hypothetical protein